MKLLDVPNILENFFKNKFESTIYQQNNITSSKQSVAKKTGYFLYIKYSKFWRVSLED